MRRTRRIAVIRRAVVQRARASGAAARKVAAVVLPYAALLAAAAALGAAVPALLRLLPADVAAAWGGAAQGAAAGLGGLAVAVYTLRRSPREAGGIAEELVAAPDLTLDLSTAEPEEGLAITDALSGVRNRRGLEAALGRLAGATVPVGVVLVRVDALRVLRRATGNRAASNLLRDSGLAFTRLLRDPGWVAHLGGGEFVVLVPGADRATTEVVAARCKAIVQALVPSSLPVGRKVSAAVGWVPPGQRADMDVVDSIRPALSVPEPVPIRARAV